MNDLKHRGLSRYRNAAQLAAVIAIFTAGYVIGVCFLYFGKCI